MSALEWATMAIGFTSLLAMAIVAGAELKPWSRLWRRK
jgi:hypothetical protein